MEIRGYELEAHELDHIGEAAALSLATLAHTVLTRHPVRDTLAAYYTEDAAKRHMRSIPPALRAEADAPLRFTVRHIISPDDTHAYYVNAACTSSRFSENMAGNHPLAAQLSYLYEPKQRNGTEPSGISLVCGSLIQAAATDEYGQRQPLLSEYDISSDLVANAIVHMLRLVLCRQNRQADIVWLHDSTLYS